MEDVPFEDRHVPRTEIAWERSVWWWHPLTRAVHPSIKMTTLIISLAALWLSKLGVYLATLAFQPSNQDQTPWTITPIWLSQFEFPSSPTTSPIMQWSGGILRAFFDLQFGTRELAFVSFVALWFTLVFGLLGGVLARRALVELGQRTIAPWGHSFSIIFRRWQGLLWATGMHLVGLAVLLAPIAILGLVAQLGTAGGTLAGVGLLICFPLAFAVGRLTLSMIFGFPLSVSAIAAEKKADAFEGFSRSNAYLFQRPVVAFFCVLFLLIVGLAGEQIVMWTLYFGWGLIRSVFLLCGGGTNDGANQFVLIANSLSTELITAFWFSYFWASSAALYLVLRRSVDGTDLDELDEIADPVMETLPEIPKRPGEEAASQQNSPAAPTSSSPEVKDAPPSDGNDSSKPDGVNKSETPPSDA